MSCKASRGSCRCNLCCPPRSARATLQELIGPQGVAGLAGAIGEQGLQGLIGAIGPAGVAGLVGGIGPQGLQGLVGAIGLQGLLGLTGAIGPAGVAGLVGLAGIQGVAGLVGERGIQGIQGIVGPQGTAGLAGEIGPAGPTGPAGPAGTSAISDYAYIYNLTSYVVPLEADVLFDSNGPITAGITHAPGSDSVEIVNAGTYSVSWSVSSVEPSQFALTVDGEPAPSTVYGSGAGTQQDAGQEILTLEAGSILTLRNHTSAAAVTLQPLAGGTQDNVNASLVILRLA